MKEGDILPQTLVTALVDKIDFTEYIPKVFQDKVPRNFPY